MPAPPIAPAGARRRRALAAFGFASATVLAYLVAVRTLPPVAGLVLLAAATWVVLRVVSTDTLARRIAAAEPTPVGEASAEFARNLRILSWLWAGLAALFAGLLSLSLPVPAVVAFVAWWAVGPRLLSSLLARWDRRVGDWRPVRVVCPSGADPYLVEASSGQ